MKLRLKILLLAAVPLLVAVAAITVAVYVQGLQLAQREKQVVESAWLASKESELRHYVSLAYSAVAPLQAAGDDEASRQRALELLAQMEFGHDGYFFVYDLHGKNLMHPRQPELVGQDLWNLRDTRGQSVIQNLLTAARRGGQQGEVVHYLWGEALHAPDRGKAGLRGGAGPLGLDAGHRHLPGRRGTGPGAHRRRRAGQHPQHVRLGGGHCGRFHPGGGGLRPGAEHQRSPAIRRQAAADGPATGALAGRRTRPAVARTARRHQPGAGVHQAVAGSRKGTAAAIVAGTARRRWPTSTARWAARWTA